MKVRVLLVDDNKHFIRALHYLIQSIFGSQISAIDEAFTGNEAIQKIESSSKYDIAFVDIDLPGKNGMEVTDYLSRNSPMTKIIAVSWHKELEMLSSMFYAGAQNYIVKDKLNELAIERAFNSIWGFKSVK